MQHFLRLLNNCLLFFFYSICFLGIAKPDAKLWVCLCLPAEIVAFSSVLTRLNLWVYPVLCSCKVQMSREAVLTRKLYAILWYKHLLYTWSEMQAERLHLKNKMWRFIIGLETLCRLVLDFTTRSICAFWEMFDLLRFPWQRTVLDALGWCKSRKSVFSSAESLGDRRANLPLWAAGGLRQEAFCWEAQGYRDSFFRVLMQLLVFQHPRRASYCCAERSWLSCPSPVSVCVCSDRSCWSEVPEDGGHPLPDGLLRWAPGLWCRRLCHPSLAVAAAHRHPAELLLPALLLVNELSLYLCPRPENRLLPLPEARYWGRLGIAFWLCVPLSAERRYAAKRRGK